MMEKISIEAEQRSMINTLEYLGNKVNKTPRDIARLEKAQAKFDELTDKLLELDDV